MLDIENGDLPTVMDPTTSGVQVTEITGYGTQGKMQDIWITTTTNTTMEEVEMTTVTKEEISRMKDDHMTTNEIKANIMKMTTGIRIEIWTDFLLDIPIDILNGVERKTEVGTMDRGHIADRCPKTGILQVWYHMVPSVNTMARNMILTSQHHLQLKRHFHTGM